MNLFPEIKTHKNNVPMFALPPHVKREAKTWLTKSLYMMGRKRELEACKHILNRVYKKDENELILVRGVMGSGKSLFMRRLLYDFLDTNRELKSKALQNGLDCPFIFISYQMPTTLMYPFNGWKTIFKTIYGIYHKEYIIKHKLPKENYQLGIGENKITIEVDLIGKILFKVDGYNCIRFIEEILEVNLLKIM